MNSPKLLLVAALALSSVQMPLYCEDQTELQAPECVPLLENQNPASVEAQKSDSIEELPQQLNKRDVSVPKMYWNGVKGNVGVMLLTFGFIGFPISLGECTRFLLSGGDNSEENIVGAALGLLLFPLIASFGYNMYQKSLNESRNEYIESYFNIPKQQPQKEM